MAEISIREQREACELCSQWVKMGLADALRAAALTLAKVERGELVPKRGLTQEQIDDIGIPYFLRDYERP